MPDNSNNITKLKSPLLKFWEVTWRLSREHLCKQEGLGLDPQGLQAALTQNSW